MARLSKSIEVEKGYTSTGVNLGGNGITGLSSTFDPSESAPELMWPLSIAVFDRMRRTDAQVASGQRAIMLSILKKRYALDPNGAAPEIVTHLAEDLGLPVVGAENPPPGRTRGRFSFKKHLRQAGLCAPYGHMPFEQVYTITGSGDAQRAHLRKLAPRMPATLADIVVARDGGLEGIVQYGDGVNGVEIGVDRLVMYTHELEGAAWAGTSILRTAYKNWLHKDRLVRVDTMTGERAGMGVVEVEMPPNVSDPGQVALYLQMGQELRAGERAAVAMPSGGHVHLRGVEGTLPDLIAKIRYHDEQIARNSMAMFMQLGTTASGSRALGTTLLDFFDMAVDAFADELVDTANEHIVEDLVDLNYGDERSPRIVHEPTQASQDLTPEQLMYLVDADIIQPDEALEMQQRARYRLPARTTPRVVRLPKSAGAIVAANTRRARRSPRAAAAAADQETAPADLPEPLATLYTRRVDLEQARNSKLTPALQLFAEATDLTDLLDLLGLVKADTTQPTGPDPRIAAAAAAAEQAMQDALTTAAGEALRDTAHAGIVESYAEGQASAAQLVSVTTGQVGVDLDTFTVSFDTAVTAALDLDSLWADTDAWLQDYIGVTSRAVGSAVADVLDSTTTRDEVLTGLRGVIEDSDTASVLYDHAMATALNDGAVSLYASEGLTEVDVLTAGDARVDAPCQALEHENPHPMTDPPSLPVHVGCRCALAPSDAAIRALLA